MYKVVLRFAVIPNAVELLRAEMFDYIGYGQVDRGLWEGLFGAWHLPDRQIPWELQAKTTIRYLVREEFFYIGSPGGPFSRDASRPYDAYVKPWLVGEGPHSTELARIQRDIELARMRPDNFEMTRTHQELWDAGFPWTEGLVKLFNATEGEITRQYQGISRDARRTHQEFATLLSPLQEIADRHLGGLRRRPGLHNFGEEVWGLIWSDLDRRRVSLDELSPRAKEVLESLREDGHTVNGWAQAANLKARTSLDDGNIYTLRPWLQKCIRNAARSARDTLGARATAQLEKPSSSLAVVTKRSATGSSKRTNQASQRATSVHPA
jgi:hypothetical protein